LQQLDHTSIPFDAAKPTISSWRRYDIDWLRILALALLIVYHVVVSFQPWATMIFFIQNEDSLEGLWIFMSLINIWRIPILFLVSGMGVRFAMERRNWKQLLKDRTIRLLIPLIFGFFFICPISVYIAMLHYGKVSGWAYFPNDGHLWFLGNIFLYVLLLLPFLTYLKNRPENIFFRALSKIMKFRGGLFLLALPVAVEAVLVNPEYFASYAKTLHGFWLGMVCFMLGYTFISIGNAFWKAVEIDRVIALALAILLYLVRLFLFGLEGPHALTALESICWMLAIFGYGSSFLNKPSRKLSYFSKAVYPVYIVHMPIQYAFSYFIIPTALPATIKLVFIFAATFGGSLALYEYVIKRLKWIRPLFGMKLRHD